MTHKREQNSLNPDALRNEKFFKKIEERIKERESEEYDTEGKPSFCTRLMLLRLELNMSKKELSEKSGISYPAINSYEQEGKVPGIDTMKVIADFFDVNVDYLMGITSVKERTSKIKEIAKSQNDDKRIIFIEKFKKLEQNKQTAIKALLNM